MNTIKSGSADDVLDPDNDYDDYYETINENENILVNRAVNTSGFAADGGVYLLKISDSL